MLIFGTYEHQIDEKGRLRIPSKIRAAVGDNFIIMCGTRNCLHIIPEAEKDRMFAGLQAATAADKDAQDTMRVLFSRTVMPEEDKQGRILLTKMQLKHAQINKDIVTIGVGYRAEIWSAELWEQFNNENNDIDSAINSLSKYGV